jgi:RHS repeat-associated protein
VIHDKDLQTDGISGQMTCRQSRAGSDRGLWTLSGLTEHAPLVLDNADRVISTTDPALAGTWGYDARGNTTASVGETRSYDASDRHRRTEKGSVWVQYVRDVTDRIVQRQTSDPSDPVVRYSYSASGDTADLTLNASNQVVEATIGLPGGVLYTFKPATPAGSVWSYPNLAGSVVAVADQAGVKQGATRWWDPDGNPLGATTVPDNSAGGFDYGWLGGHQRPVEQLAGLVATVQMGARQYVPRLGRFLQVDPVEGGGANDYAYPHDPVNMNDLDGKFRKCKWCRKFARKASRFARRAAPFVAFAGMAVCAVATAGACAAAGLVGLGVSFVQHGGDCIAKGCNRRRFATALARFGGDVALNRFGGRGVRSAMAGAVRGHVSKNLARQLGSGRESWSTIGRGLTYCRNCWSRGMRAGRSADFRNAGAWAAGTAN